MHSRIYSFNLYLPYRIKSYRIAPYPIHLDSKVKLTAYLEAFHVDCEDPQFQDERRLLIDTLDGLEEPPMSLSGDEVDNASAPLSATASHDAQPSGANSLSSTAFSSTTTSSSSATIGYPPESADIMVDGDGNLKVTANNSSITNVQNTFVGQSSYCDLHTSVSENFDSY